MRLASSQIFFAPDVDRAPHERSPGRVERHAVDAAQMEAGLRAQGALGVGDDHRQCAAVRGEFGDVEESLVEAAVRDHRNGVVRHHVLVALRCVGGEQDAFAAGRRSDRPLPGEHLVPGDQRDGRCRCRGTWGRGMGLARGEQCPGQYDDSE